MKRLGPALLLAVLVLLPFRQLLVHPGWIVAPGSDVVEQLAVHHEAASLAVADGEWPWWNPWRGAGGPHLANPQTSLFHPMSLVALVVSPEQIYTGSFALHQWWGALGMLVWLRLRGSSLSAALLGGVLLALNGKLLAHAQAGNLNMVAQAAWMPWAFAALERSITHCSRGAAAACAAIMTMAFLGGHLQEWYYLMLALAVLALWHLPPAQSSDPEAMTGVAKRALFAALPVLLAAAMLAIQLLPSMELGAHTTRAMGLGATQAAQQAITGDHLLTLLTPRFFGPIGEAYWGPYHPWERYLYLGILPLALVPIGSWRVLRRGDRTARMMLAFTIFACLFAMGGATFRWCFEWIPGMDLFRIPTRMLFLAVIGFALLAAAGLEELLEDPPRAKVAAAIAAAVALVLAAMHLWIGADPATVAPDFARWILRRIEADLTDPLPRARLVTMIPPWLEALRVELAVQAAMALGTAFALFAFVRFPSRRRFAIAGLLAVLVLDLARVGMPLVHTEPASTLMPVSAAILELERRADREPPFRVLDLGRTLNPAVAIRHHVEKLDLYDPVILDRLRRLTNLQVPDGPQQRYTWLPIEELRVTPRTDLRPMRLLNVRYLASRDALEHPELEEIPLAADSAEAASPRLYRFTAAGPRVRWVPRARWFPDTPEGETALLAELTGTDPEHEVLLLGEDQGEGLDEGTARAAHEPTHAVRWHARTANELDFELHAPDAGWVVIAANHYPGWSAEVNGAAVEISAASLAFQAVPVEAGRNRVRLRFRPTWLPVGLTVTLLGLLGTLALALAPRRQPHSAKSAPKSP